MAATDIEQAGGLPRSIAIWGDEPQKIRLPEEPFDPHGAWSQLYSVYILGPLHDENWRGAFRSAGALRLERRPRDDDGFDQTGRRVEQMISKTWLATAWEATYDGDALASPRTWTFSSDLYFNGAPVDADFRYLDIARQGYAERALPMTDARYTFSGRREPEAIVNEGAAARPVAPGETIAANWGLFDAVQRLDADLAAPLSFAVLDDFDLYKPGHTLRSAGSLTVTFADGPVQLHGFRQNGRGILPYAYWVTDTGRLVFAVGGYQGYVLNPDEPIGEMLS